MRGVAIIESVTLGAISWQRYVTDTYRSSNFVNSMAVMSFPSSVIKRFGIWQEQSAEDNNINTLLTPRQIRTCEVPDSRMEMFLSANVCDIYMTS